MQKPKWAIADFVADITDNWLDIDGDDNISVEAYLDRTTIESVDERHDCFNSRGLVLNGIALCGEEGVKVYRGRSAAINLFGGDVVEKIEMMEV